MSTSPNTAEVNEAVRKLFSRWLGHGLSGCTFASHLASKKDASDVFVVDEVDDDTPADLDTFLRAAHGRKKLLLVIFRRMREAAHIRRLLRVIGRASRVEGSRWTIEQASDSEGHALLDLFWAPPGEDRASIVGFAPLGSMPVSRRAPFVAMVAWTAGRANTNRTKRDSFVSVGDAPFDGADYPTLLASTKAQLADMRLAAGEGKPGKTLTFRLAPSPRRPSAKTARAEK